MLYSCFGPFTWTLTWSLITYWHVLETSFIVLIVELWTDTLETFHKFSIMSTKSKMSTQCGRASFILLSKYFRSLCHLGIAAEQVNCGKKKNLPNVHRVFSQAPALTVAQETLIRFEMKVWIVPIFSAHWMKYCSEWLTKRFLMLIFSRF